MPPAPSPLTLPKGRIKRERAAPPLTHPPIDEAERRTHFGRRGATRSLRSWRIGADFVPRESDLQPEALLCMSAPQSAADVALQRTPLFSAHVAAGARMVAFADYEMPVQYAAGVLKEHLWTRENAGLFDVSHMGLFTLRGPDHATTARALEALMPADILALAPGRQRYTQLLDENGGIIDDLMVTRPAGGPAADGALLLVVNAARKSLDEACLAARLPSAVPLDVARDRALIALQGPDAAGV